MTYHDRLLVLILGLCLTGTAAFAETDVAVGGIRMERQGNVPGFPGDVEDSLEAKVPAAETDEKSVEKGDAESDEEKDQKGGIETIIAPIPSRSPLLGWTLSVPAMLLYRPPGSDPANQVWVSGTGGKARYRSKGITFGLWPATDLDMGAMAPDFLFVSGMVIRSLLPAARRWLEKPSRLDLGFDPWRMKNPLLGPTAFFTCSTYAKPKTTKPSPAGTAGEGFVLRCCRKTDCLFAFNPSARAKPLPPP